MSSTGPVPRLNLGATEPSSSRRLDVVESLVFEQREVIQQLFDAFKILTDENRKKADQIRKVEASNAQLRDLVAGSLVENLELVKVKVDAFTKVETLEAELTSVRQEIKDLQFFTSQSGELYGAASRGVGLPPFMDASSPSMGLSRGKVVGAGKLGGGGLEPLHAAVESVLSGMEYISKQRNSDVESINATLDRLDSRTKQLASAINLHGAGVESGSAGSLRGELRVLKEELLPELESEWSLKWSALADKLDVLRSEVSKQRSDLALTNEKSAGRDARVNQLLMQADGQKKSIAKSEQISLDLNHRVLKLEADMTYAFDEIKRVEDAGHIVPALESKLDLSKSECKANYERVVRQNKQDIDSLRVKVERIAVVRDEYERISSDMKNLHDLVINQAMTTGDKRFGRDIPVSPPPLTQSFAALERTTASLESSSAAESDSSSLSLLDEGFKPVRPGITVRLSAHPAILVPTGGNEAGSLRVDTNRILWRIEGMASIMREPNRFPKIFVSPEFTATGPPPGGSTNASLTARLKLFPHGSDQSKIDGNCSFYLRCLPGVVVRYAIDVGGELKDTFECEYEKQRDKGKHDFVKLNEYLDPDGSVTIGVELKAVYPMTAIDHER